METKPKRLPFPWLFRWKLWRNVLLALVGLVTAYALFCAEENLRGKHAWETYKSKMEAKGEVLDFRKFVPPPVPDAQNFAATPFFAQLFDYVPGTHTLRDTNSWARVWKPSQLFPDRVREALDRASWQDIKSLDFVDLENEWLATNRSTQKPVPLNPKQSSEAIQTLTARLQPAMAAIEEMRVASQRPYSRFNLEYELEPKFGILLPHLAPIRGACRWLELRSCAELRLGETDAAFADVAFMFRLVHSLQTEPFLISQNVRAACLSATLQPIWEGLEQRKWSDAQLEKLTEELRGLDFMGSGIRCLQAEQSFCDTFFDQLRKSRNPIQDISDVTGNGNDFSPGFPTAFVIILAASGWYYLEQLNYHKLYYNQTVGVITPNRVDPFLANEGKVGPLALNSVGEAFLKHVEMAKLLLPSLNSVVFKITRAQTAANLATIACALERYRLKHSNYPENLSALTPEYLNSIPNDLILDQPLKYRLTANGSFVLYSVGWNNKDDGGVPAKNVHPRVYNDMTDGDWVWEYPAALSSK